MVRTVLASLVFASITFTGVSMVIHFSGLTEYGCASPAVVNASASAQPVASDTGDRRSAPAMNAGTAAHVIAGIGNFVACRTSGNNDA